jgi:transcriptional regulator with XRE-family HTH domain
VASGDLQRAFGDSLRILRKSKGLSQERFADEIGVHRTYMGGVERGERNLTLRSVEFLCDRIGANPLEMLRGISDEEQPGF